MLPSIKGVAIGVTGLTLTHRVDVIVGLGAAGFVAGPYGYLNSSVGITRGSSVGFDAGFGVLGHGQVCKQESVAIAAGAVRYQMPQPVTDTINFLLSALHINERIQGRGGIGSTQRCWSARAGTPRRASGASNDGQHRFPHAAAGPAPVVLSRRRGAAGRDCWPLRLRAALQRGHDLLLDVPRRRARVSTWLHPVSQPARDERHGDGESHVGGDRRGIFGTRSRQHARGADHGHTVSVLEGEVQSIRRAPNIAAGIAN